MTLHPCYYFQGNMKNAANLFLISKHLKFKNIRLLRRKTDFKYDFFSRSCTSVSQRSTLWGAAEIIRSPSCSKILVVAGAGISTPSGIPDFRSPDTGLYDNLNDYNLQQPTDIFDLQFLRKNPAPFFKLAKQLYPGNFKPNYVHYFLKLLHEKKKLLRVYTQNIDSLESLAGVPDDLLVEAHGSFMTATCMKCRERYTCDFIKGVVKPDVVFFGEDLPDRFFLCHDDLPNANMILVLGTSLEVFPVAGIVYNAPKHIPQVLINKQVVAPFDGDVDINDKRFIYCGDIVNGIKELVNLLDWNEDMSNMWD